MANCISRKKFQERRRSARPTSELKDTERFHTTRTFGDFFSPNWDGNLLVSQPPVDELCGDDVCDDSPQDAVDHNVTRREAGTRLAGQRGLLKVTRMDLKKK